jgi:hypothetical protein
LGRRNKVKKIIIIGKVGKMMRPDETVHAQLLRDWQENMQNALLHNLNIYINQLLAERKQIRFPRSKKKRIRRKWAKCEENYRLCAVKVEIVF